MIEADRLTKVYRTSLRQPGFLGAVKGLFVRERRDIVAVQDLSFTIEPGELVGYIGPNGAGKSTTIKMLTGVLVPTAGRVHIKGIDPHRQRVRNAQQIGAVFGQRSQLWWDLPLIESFELLRRIYQVPRPIFDDNLRYFRRLLDLTEFERQPVRQLSLGQRMRGEVVASLLHNPAVLFLDEPTIGMDVQARQRLRTFLRALNHDRGVTIILTTHDLHEIEELCSRVMVIDKGHIIFDGNLDRIRKLFGTYRTAIFDLATDVTAVPTDLLDEPLRSVVEIQVEGRRLSARFNAQLTTGTHLIRAVLAKVEVDDLRIDETPIEHMITQIYEGRTV